MIDIEAIRQRVHHHLDPDTARATGLTVADLQQFIARHFTPSDEQLTALALRFGIPRGGTS